MSYMVRTGESKRDSRSENQSVLCSRITHWSRRSPTKADHASRSTLHAPRSALIAFTLIELILVMTILTIGVSITAPRLANFFQGRALDSEARRLLSLTRQGQSRAVAEGLPMELWIDSSKGAYGLEAEPSYDPSDSKAVNIALDSNMQIEAASLNTAAISGAAGLPISTDSASSTPMKSNHPSLPRIIFLSDGSISETSPQKVRLTGRDGTSLWLVLSQNRLNYEIQNQNN